MSEESEFIETISEALEGEREQEIRAYAREVMKAEIEAEKKQPAYVPANTVYVTTPNGNNYIQQQVAEYQEEQRRIEEKQKELLEEMDMESEEHLVRGAILRCKCGSHCRRLNLPLTHGYMEAERPLMNAKDAVPLQNITYFGVCSSPANKSAGNNILLKKDYERDPHGKIISKAVTGNVSGSMCTPIILGAWKNTQKWTTIDGAPAITPSSFLICQFGGIIEVLDSGQHDEATLEGV